MLKFSLPAVSLILAVSLHAAPPAVNGLYPAGAQRGSTVEITAIGTFDTWPVSVWTSSPHLTATAGKDKGKVTITVAADAPPGTYWIRCHDTQGSSGLRPFIVGGLPELQESESNDTVAKSQQVTMPAMVNGKLNRNGDVDCYAVKLKRGQTLVASVESHQTLRSAGDMVMQLTNAAGTKLGQNHDYHGLDPRMVYTAKDDGVVIVRLFAFPANPDSSIRFAGGELYVYRLTVTVNGFADHALPLAVQGAKPEPVRLVGWNLAPGSMAGTVMPRGERADVYHRETAGVVPVRLERWPTIDDTVPGQPPNATLTAPVCITGQLSREQPVYQTKIRLDKGKKFTVQVISPGLGLDVDPVLTIKDSTGKELLQAETKGLHIDLNSSFTPTQEGVFTIMVRDLHKRHGTRMVFLLRVVPEVPHYELTVNADRFTLTAGKPLDIPVTVISQAGFKEEVQLNVNGLPASVTWKTVSSTGPADKKVITIRLEGKETLSRGFEILGEVKGQPHLKKTAGANVGELGISTSFLWLTCVKK